MNQKNLEKLAKVGESYLKREINGEIEEIKRHLCMWHSEFRNKTDINKELGIKSGFKIHLNNYLDLSYEMENRYGLDISKLQTKVGKWVDYQKYQELYTKLKKEEIGLGEMNKQICELLNKSKKLKY